MTRTALLLVILTTTVCTAARAETAIAVMSFNVRYGSADDGDNSWEFRRETLANTIRRYEPDILGVQECLEFQAQFITDSIEGFKRFGAGRNANGTGERMEVFYRAERFSPIRTGNFWLSETPDVPGSRDWDSANIRMVTWAKFYDLANRDFFYYFNTHFDHRSEWARAEAAKVLRRAVKKIAGRDPAIVTGDFNAVAEASEPWMTLTAKKLSDAWMDSEKRIGPPVTWSGFEAPDPENSRIDWILYSGALTVKHCETVTYNESGRFPSDHFPVFVRFSRSR